MSLASIRIMAVLERGDLMNITYIYYMSLGDTFSSVWMYFSWPSDYSLHTPPPCSFHSEN